MPWRDYRGDVTERGVTANVAMAQAKSGGLSVAWSDLGIDFFQGIDHHAGVEAG